MFLEIITPDKKVFEGEVVSAQFPGTNGSFEILDHHAPVISTLDRGQIRVVTTNAGQQFFTVDGGVVEVLNNNIIVLAESVMD